MSQQYPSPMPPAPSTAARKSIWKQWWFWVALVVVIGVIGSLAGNAEEGDSAEPASTTPTVAPTASAEVLNPVETVKVPDLLGLSLTKATAVAEQLGLEIEVEHRYSSKPAGTVLSIGPAPGTQLDLGSTVRLVVAKALPRIPNVVGDKVDAARRTLEAKGFTVQVKRQASSEPKDTVLSQSPSAGTLARPGRKVTLLVAKAQPSSGGGGSCAAGYSPCLPSGPSDYDCYGGSGDGPAYTKPGVTYRVTGSDPYGLDSDGDGYGCE